MVGAGRFELPTPGPPDMDLGQLMRLSIEALSFFLFGTPGLISGHHEVYLRRTSGAACPLGGSGADFR